MVTNYGPDEMTLGETARMGPRLQAEVQRQLLNDLAHYGITSDHAVVDWSDACQEGHCTSYLDGNLEELSGLVVRNAEGKAIAEGWMDFIHGGGSNPLFVFWLFLSILDGDNWVKVKKEPTIPEHTWLALPDATKELCGVDDSYDARWTKDPTVKSWKARGRRT